ncbi:unnamed protein product [Ilex paraguariensis]|uniref:Aminotransferase class I/classII domain-containing protein n=1 Tax=Ilex paraguariensis TaxID=185542 RepID=A0ABC8SDC4_9AQUA
MEDFCTELCTVAETARKLGILVIADEVYDHLTFGSNPFVPMGVFGSIAPVITIANCITGFLNISSDPATFIQGAVPQILEKTNEDFFSKILTILKEAADFCYHAIMEIPCITCPSKPEGSMFVMVKLNLSLLEGITDDVDFCVKLAKEESVIVMPDSLVAKRMILLSVEAESSTRGGAVPQILEKTNEDFFSKILTILKEAADFCYHAVMEIPCITCPSKPEGSMFVMVKLNLSLLEGITDDVDFCVKLAKEESVIVMPDSLVAKRMILLSVEAESSTRGDSVLHTYKKSIQLVFQILKVKRWLVRFKMTSDDTMFIAGVAVGLKNWLRITFAIEPSSLKEGLERIKAFYQRHAKKQ